MKIPFLTEASVDMIIRAFKYSGILPDTADQDTIRTIDPNTDETGRDKIASLFNYGTTGGGGLVSTTDVYALIDSDNTVGVHRNDLIVGRGQATSPITDWSRRLFSVGFDTSTETATSKWIESVVGTTTLLMDSSGPTTAYVNTHLDIGCIKNSAKRSAFGRLYGADDATKIDEGPPSTYSGVSLRSYGSLELTAGHNDVASANITFRASNEQFRNGGDTTLAATIDRQIGGLSYSNSTDIRTFYVGPTFANGHDSLLIRQVRDAHYDKIGFELRMAQSANGANDGRMLNISTVNTDYNCYYTINGSVTDSAEPFNRYPIDDVVPAPSAVFSVFGAAGTMAAAKRPTALLASLAPLNTAGGVPYDVVQIRASDGDTGGDNYWLLRAEQWDAVFSVWNTRFKVSNIGNVWADGAFTGGGADLAELLTPAESVEIGDVLVVNSSSEYVKSSTDVDPCVVGVVAEKPGMMLGHGGDPATKTPMTVCGITPVRCTTEVGGSIVPGDLLVATTGGRARKSPSPAAPGTILGKALQPLAKDGDNDVTEKISVLVILQ